jgi:archaellum biogenesis ATPase FlaH
MQQESIAQPASNESEAWRAERTRLIATQRRLLSEKRYLLLAADVLLDRSANQRERELATYLIRTMQTQLAQQLRHTTNLDETPLE